MNSKDFRNSMTRQRGAATLAITLIVLLLITVITLFTGRSIVTDQRVSANEYRAEQAEAAASAALQVGVSLTDRIATGQELRVDRNGNGNSTDTSPPEAILRHVLVDPSTGAPTLGLLHFDRDNPFQLFVVDPSTGLRVRGNLWYKLVPDPLDTDCAAEITAERTHPCDPPTHNANCAYSPLPALRVCAEGFSDDGTARHRMTIITARVNLGESGRPSIPMTAYGTVDLGGTFRVTNYFSNDTVWTGKTVPLQGTPSTRLRNPTDSTLPSCGSSPCCLADNDYQQFINDHMLLTSHPDVGVNADIIDNDPNIARLTEDQFWALFFGDMTKAAVEELAKDAGQRYAAGSVPDLNGKTGIIWIEGNWSTSNANLAIGTLDYPAVLIVNGNLTTNGGTFDGLVYVTGTFTGGGGARFNGIMAVEDDRPSSGESVPKGNGTVDLCYDPGLARGINRTPKDAVGPISGTWRDWNVY